MVFARCCTVGKCRCKAAMEQDQNQIENETKRGVYSLLITMFLLVVPFPGTQRGGLCALGLIGSTKAGSFNTVH